MAKKQDRYMVISSVGEIIKTGPRQKDVHCSGPGWMLDFKLKRFVHIYWYPFNNPKWRTDWFNMGRKIKKNRAANLAPASTTFPLLDPAIFDAEPVKIVVLPWGKGHFLTLLDAILNPEELIPPYCRIQLEPGIDIHKLDEEFRALPESEHDVPWPEWIIRKGYGKLLEAYNG